MKSILAFLATFLAASLFALCAAGAAPPRVHVKNPELPVVLVNPGAEFQDAARPGAMIIGMDRTPQQAATVQNINARFFLRRLRSGRILLVKNGSPAERLQKRTHMSAWLSDDEGQTWRGGLLLDERHAVSHPDGFEAPDGLIHILYDWNRHSDAEIHLAKFREEDVLASKIVSSDAKLLMLANKATGPRPEKLYNGIQLPDVWPPRFRDPASDAPMPVPYIAHPPRVIPIDIGRQLFVDDFLIEKTTLKRTFHPAQKYDANPVFKAETAVEKERNEAVYLGQGGVFYDPSDKLFKMFYTAGWRGPLAMATSPDLKRAWRLGTSRAS